MEPLTIFGLLLLLLRPAWQEMARNPLLHSATDREVVLRQEDGSYKLAYDAEDGFRAETRGKDGVVKGVFGHRSPSGKLVTQTYLSDDQGFRLAPLTELGVELPPLPYYLQPKAGQRKFPKETDEEEKENVKVKERRDENSWGGLKLASSYINGRLDEASDAVVLEPLDANSEDVSITGDERPFGALVGLPDNQEQSYPSQGWIQAQASAISGNGGVAQAGAHGSAFVGRGGVAVATVMGTVRVGPGGVAISTPVAGSSAGNGGIAIAGAEGLTIYAPPPALPSPGAQGSVPVYQQDISIPAETAPALTRPLDLPLPAGAKITAYPIVANYFFSSPQQAQYPQQPQQSQYPTQSQYPQQSQQSQYPAQTQYPTQSQYPQQSQYPRPQLYQTQYPSSSFQYPQQQQSQFLKSSHGEPEQSQTKGEPLQGKQFTQKTGQSYYRHHQIVVVPWVQH